MVPVFNEALLDRLHKHHFCLLVVQVIQSLTSQCTWRHQEKTWLLDIVKNLQQFFKSVLCQVFIFETECQSMHRLILSQNIPKHIEGAEKSKLLFLLTAWLDQVHDELSPEQICIHVVHQLH